MDSRGRLWHRLALLAAVLTLASAQRDYSDLRGSYCASRRPDCCAGREDECSTPILGTLCYCDDFCNRTRSEDCCPDFWSHCKGIEAPQETFSCYHNGRYFGYGQSVKSNCNECKCQTMGGRPELLCEQHECLVEPELIASVNAERRRGWRASNYTDFWGRRLDEGVSLRLGTLQPHRAVMHMRPVRPVYDPSRLPRAFDARDKWSGLQDIHDQRWCGSSWALSTAAVASDRFAVLSQGREGVTLSTQHLLSCNNRGQQGCQGGNLDRAWTHIRKFGLVPEDCYPYTATASQCRIRQRSTLLPADCSPQRSASGKQRTSMYRVGPAYRLGSEQDIMHEILQSGPVQATMKVYPDFFVYEGGVYSHSHPGERGRTGYHSVRIVGWGEDVSGNQAVKYWLVANSWGPQWGERGYFRIVRGQNECEIETFVLATWADTTRPEHDEARLSNDV